MAFGRPSATQQCPPGTVAERAAAFASRLLLTENTELVPLDVRQDDERPVVSLPDVDPTCPKTLEPRNVASLISGVEVQVDPVLDRFALRHWLEDDARRPVGRLALPSLDDDLSART